MDGELWWLGACSGWDGDGCDRDLWWVGGELHVVDDDYCNNLIIYLGNYLMVTSSPLAMSTWALSTMFRSGST